MTKALSLKAAAISLLFVVLAAAALVVQYVTSLLQKGMADSASIRVAAENTCTTGGEGTHFTGCSSIL